MENKRFEIVEFFRKENMVVDGWIEETISGISSGSNASCGTITITNGVTSVTATKGYGETNNSIGAGTNGNSGTVTIEPGANVTQN